MSTMLKLRFNNYAIHIGLCLIKTVKVRVTESKSKYLSEYVRVEKLVVSPMVPVWSLYLETIMHQYLEELR